MKSKRVARAEKKTRACSYPPVTSYLLTFPHDKCHGEGRRDAMTPLFRDRCNNSTDGIFITHSSLFQLQFDKIKIRRARVGGVMRHSVLFTLNAELLNKFTRYEHNCQWITFSVFNQWPFNESAFTSSGVNACVFGNRNETFPCLRFSLIWVEHFNLIFVYSQRTRFIFLLFFSFNYVFNWKIDLIACRARNSYALFICTYSILGYR